MPLFCSVSFEVIVLFSLSLSLSLFLTRSSNPAMAGGIFSQPTLQSALTHLSIHIEKQTPSSSQLPQTLLLKLHQSLLSIAERLPLENPTSTHFLTQLHDIAYAAADLVDQLQYKSLEQEVQDFTGSTQLQPIAGPSIAQFKGFQTGENDAQIQPVSIPAVQVSGGSPPPSKSNEFDVDKGLAAQETNQSTEPVKEVSNGSSLSKFSSFNQTSSDHSVKKAKDGSSSSSQSVFKKLCSAISRMCKCLDGKNAENPVNGNPISGPEPEHNLPSISEQSRADCRNAVKDQVGGSLVATQNDDTLHSNEVDNAKPQEHNSEMVVSEPISGQNVGNHPDVVMGREGGSLVSTDNDDTLHKNEVDGTNPKDIGSEDSIEDRINKMVEQLDSFAAQLEDAVGFRQECRDFKGSIEFVNNSVMKGKVYGRDDEREQLVKMLVESDDDENVSVLPIFGAEGIGKTTLAYHVYSDERVMKHFHTREWICASDTFDMMRIAGELEESLYLSGPFDQVQLLSLFEKNLEAELKGKRFLIVLDDVRCIDWATRFAAIGIGAKGSKILLTARKEGVVDEVAKRNKIILKGLKRDAFWSFFKECAFGGEVPDKHQDLENIGKEIVEKLEGFPLATKMVGGVLRDNLSASQWTNILRSELWESTDIMPALRICFHHLPSHLKWCFAYCSVFPKGYAFDVNQLVHIWMAQGLVLSANMNRRAEDIGLDYFDHLLSRSFFELPMYNKSYWRTKYCLMHDLLHDLAKSICFDECFVYKSDESGKVPYSVRHLSITHWAGLNSEFQWQNLRTLMINTKYVTDFELLKSVRVLDLSHSYLRQLPDSIGHLIHIRYLNLWGNTIYTLPESLCKLYHLETLIAPHRCRRLPKGMANLINLRHLSANNEAISWIAWIGRLTCLQQLKEFHVRKVSGHDIGQLQGMRELRGQLCIQCLDDVKTKEEAIQAHLRDKSHVRKLQLKWMRWNRSRKPDAHEEVLECLEPPPGLEELEIHWYRGLRSPSWLKEHMLQNLQSIHLRGCDKWNHLPPLGGLPKLEVLKIEGMDTVIDGGGEVFALFQSLKELWLEDSSISFESMTSVPEPDLKFFPRLHKLVIRNCKKVKGLPPLSMLQTLTELELSKCTDLDAELPDCLKGLTSLSKLKISDLQLASFPGEVFQWLKHLEIDSCENLTSWLTDEENSGSSSLTSLSITDGLLPTGPILMKYLTSLQELRLDRCSKLKSFTAEQQKWFKELSLLRELSIVDCKSLRSLPAELHRLPSLEKLTVSGCPAIRSLPIGLPLSLKRLEISNCNPGLAGEWQDERAPDWVKRVPYRYLA